VRIFTSNLIGTNGYVKEKWLTGTPWQQNDFGVEKQNNTARVSLLSGGTFRSNFLA
jgi:hypothetical protein